METRTSTSFKEIDQHFINRCKNGEDQALSDLYHSSITCIKKACSKYISCSHDIEDVSHDTFLKLLTKLDIFDHERGNFFAWCSRIACNEALMFLRFKNKASFETIDNHYSSLNSTVPTPEQNMLCEDIFIMINELPLNQSKIFQLRAAGYDHNEIASSMGIVASTSRSQYNWARKKLMEKIPA